MEYVTKVRRQLLLAATAIVFASGASAQSYPSRGVKIIAPFPAGGQGIDLVARALANELQTATGQAFTVENRPGGGTVIGTAAVASAPADGHTLLIMANSFTVNPSLQSRLPYESRRDFVPVTLLTITPHVLIARPQLAANTLAEALQVATTRKDRLNYASIGNGTSPHLAGESLKKISKADLTHIPYKGQAPALQALMAGEVDLMFANLPDVLPFLESKKIKALAISAPSRDPSLPQVPTMEESGVPGFESNSWYGLMVRAGTDEAIVRRLHELTTGILHSPKISQQFSSRGLRIIASTPAEFGQWLDKEYTKYEEIVKFSGAKID
ncbi:tripartite tricarboxylate transporter substrate binding protein [Diaphorobacter sp. JS3051]|uniref:Bug family tripartite tricarboxylate transporter substrate binding protein n=1 Tax=Diaphorobacter sp. JS3051 TaxID=2792224 RepID=UPI0018C918F7|nr:tripartite tricarboxylate transporter substrate binding protein [Diaphorobacter sp. JS3051]QPN32328.1 tripartite tricarboxylate transporter substrate binding protein [Diaphorobacter sp. JS3051]